MSLASTSATWRGRQGNNCFFPPMRSTLDAHVAGVHVRDLARAAREQLFFSTDEKHTRRACRWRPRPRSGAGGGGINNR